MGELIKIILCAVNLMLGAVGASVIDKDNYKAVMPIVAFCFFMAIIMYKSSKNEK